MSLIFSESEKSNKNHAISAYNLFGTDNSVPNELISVPRLIGSRTVFLSDDISLIGLYDMAIY